MDKEGRIVIGMDWDGTMRDSMTEFRKKRFRSENPAVMAAASLGFALVDLFGMGTNASNNIESSHVNEVFKETVRGNADDGVRIVCTTRNNHRNQIRALFEKEGIRDQEGVLDVIHSRRGLSKMEDIPKDYSIDILVDDSIIRELRDGRKGKDHIMWAGYSHNAVFGRLFRKLGFTNVVMNKDELVSMSKDMVESAKQRSKVAQP